MKHIKKFNQIITEDEYNKYLEEINKQFNDIQRAKEDLNYYLDIVSTLIESGGTIYRLVFLENQETLKKENLGKHWNIDGDFSRFIGNLESDIEEGYKPYIITAIIPPDFIDIESSLGQYAALPLELEINLKGNPTEFTIKRYHDNFKYRN